MANKIVGTSENIRGIYKISSHMNVNADIQFNNNQIDRSLNFIDFTNAMVNSSKNTYISAEHSINHLQSNTNDKKAYIKNFKMFIVIAEVHRND